MVNKDLRNFVTFIPVMEKMHYSTVPISDQEAILFILALNNQDPITSSPAYISHNTKLRMTSYTEIYTTFTNTRERLEKQFAETYWFYLHFGEVESIQVEEKKDNTGST